MDGPSSIQPQAPAPEAPRFTWRAYLLFFCLSILVNVLVATVLRPLIGHDRAFGAGAGAATPILLSGNPRWKEPKILCWALIVVALMAALGALIVPMML